MGCDIHLSIEYKKYDDWWSFGLRNLHLDRNYTIFGLMAKVREDFDDGFSPKGLPKDISWTTQDANLLFITDDEGEGCCTLEKAKYYEDKCGCEIIYLKNKPTWVTHPDWHSHSWLTVSEFGEVLEKYRNKTDNVAIEYEVLWVILKRLVDFYSHENVRIVFWFDN
jgi:hypothetical protein